MRKGLLVQQVAKDNAARDAVALKEAVDVVDVVPVDDRGHQVIAVLVGNINCVAHKFIEEGGSGNCIFTVLGGEVDDKKADKPAVDAGQASRGRIRKIVVLPDDFLNFFPGFFRDVWVPVHNSGHGCTGHIRKPGDFLAVHWAASFRCLQSTGKRRNITRVQK